MNALKGGLIAMAVVSIFAVIGGFIAFQFFGPPPIAPEKVYDALVAGEPGCEVIRPSDGEFDWNAVARKIRPRNNEVRPSVPAEVVDVRCPEHGVTIRVLAFKDRFSTPTMAKYAMGPVDQLDVANVKTFSGSDRIAIGHGTARRDGAEVPFASATGRRENVWISVVADKSEDELRSIWNGAANALPR